MMEKSILKSIPMFSFLELREEGAVSIHFLMAFAENDEYFKQVTGERLVTEFKKGVPRKVWKQIYHHVEALDCFVYAYAAAVLKGLSRMTDDGWNQLEGMILSANDEGESASQSKPRKKVVVESKFMRG